MYFECIFFFSKDVPPIKRICIECIIIFSISFFAFSTKDAPPIQPQKDLELRSPSGHGHGLPIQIKPHDHH